MASKPKKISGSFIEKKEIPKKKIAEKINLEKSIFDEESRHLKKTPSKKPVAAVSRALLDASNLRSTKRRPKNPSPKIVSRQISGGKQKTTITSPKGENLEVLTRGRGKRKSLPEMFKGEANKKYKISQKGELRISSQ